MEHLGGAGNHDYRAAIEGQNQNGSASGDGNRAGRKIALITGITGQDGSYLAELLLQKGYEGIFLIGLAKSLDPFLDAKRGYNSELGP